MGTTLPWGGFPCHIDKTPSLEVLLGKKPLRLFARELFVRAGTVISRQWEHSRIAALYELTQGRGRVAVATAEGLLQKTSPPQALCDAAVKLEVFEIGRASCRERV